jgi:hypothetical protein
MNDQKQKTNEEIEDETIDVCKIASATDCTGLIQKVPLTKAEMDSYEELYPFRPPYINEDDDT